MKNSALKNIGTATLMACGMVLLYNYSKEQSKPINKVKRTVGHAIDETAETIMGMNLKSKK